MDVPSTKLSYSSKEFDSLGFHDCYVHGFRWNSSNYSLMIELDYIVKWVEKEGAFDFWVAPAELCFKNASETKMTLDWDRFAPECQIQDIHRRDHRKTPNSIDDYLWEIEFAKPYGSIELWATDFLLSIQASPVLRAVQHLRD